MNVNLLNILRKARAIRYFLVIFYSVGVAGLTIPATRDLFISLTPWALLMNLALLVLHHQDGFSKKYLIIFGIIAVAGFLVEIIGVQTGIIFGDYAYGSGLGIQLMDTPLLIGINWLILVYTTASITQKVNTSGFIKILQGASMMLVYDLIMEQVAPRMDMWSWKDDVVPVENYIAWWIIAAIFHTLFQVFKIRVTNPLSVAVLLIQFFFFVLLYFLM